MRRNELAEHERATAKNTDAAKPPRTSLEKWLALLTAIASLAAAGLGVIAAEINVQKNKAQATAESKGADLSTVQDENDRLEKQNNQLAAENSSLRSPPPSTAPSGEPSASTAPDASSQLLSELTPLNTNAVNSPRPVTIGTQVYPAVAGYEDLKARVGLDNNESGTAAKSDYASIIRVTADNGRQLGDEFRISLSKPADLAVPLDGAVQATIKCTLVDPRGGTSGYYRAAFGDATITK
jgi:cell division protein FtsB